VQLTPEEQADYDELNRNAVHLVWTRERGLIPVSELSEKGRKERYLNIPLRFVESAVRLPGKAPLLVALAIQFEVSVKRSHTVALPNHLLKAWGADHWSKQRGLQALEKAGLITVQYRPRANPIVTLTKRSTS
jgi:hypothetical protein